MDAQLTAQAQKLPAKVFEARGVRVGFERRVHIVVVVLDDKPGESDAVFLDQTCEVGPPHVGVKVAHRGIEVALDVLARPAGHRRGEVVEIEGAAINDRPGKRVSKQAECLCIDAAHAFFGKTEVAEDDPALAVGVLPNKRQFALVGCHSVHRAVLRKRNDERRLIGVGESKVMRAAAEHKVGGKTNARRHVPASSHFLHAKLLGERLEKPIGFRRQVHHELTAVTHPGHKVGRALPQARQVAHRENHFLIACQIRQLLLGQIDQISLDACLVEHRLDIVKRVGRRHLV